MKAFLPSYFIHSECCLGREYGRKFINSLNINNYFIVVKVYEPSDTWQLHRNFFIFIFCFVYYCEYKVGFVSQSASVCKSFWVLVHGIIKNKLAIS